MNRRRRAALLLGLALLLGGMAASDVAGRESAIRRAIGRPVPVVVTRTAVPAGARLTRARLAVRRVPARYAPAGSFRTPQALLGLRAAVALGPGADLAPELLEDGGGPRPGPPVRPGERIAEIIARGSAQMIGPGARVDVLVTRQRDGAAGSTSLALEDAEVVEAVPVAAGTVDAGDGGSRVAVSLRVTLRQAVYLAAAQSFAHELRVLARAPGDRRRGAQGLTIGAGLG